MLAALTCPRISVAQGFTGIEFLEWSNADQRGYVSAQLVMASTLASRINQEMADCINATYFEDGGMSDEGFRQVGETIGQYPDYHPSSILVVHIEQKCGAFGP